MQTTLNTMWNLRTNLVTSVICAVLVACAGCASGQVNPAQKVRRGEEKMAATVHLNVDTSNGRVLVELTILNSDQGSVLYLEKAKVLAVPAVSVNVFQITCLGEKVPYLGAMVKRKAPGPEDYFRLPAGAEFKQKVDITGLYGFHQGNCRYQIRYSAFHGDPKNASNLTALESGFAEFTYDRR